MTTFTDTSDDAYMDIGASPYKVPLDTQANPSLVPSFGDPYDDMLGQLRLISMYLERISNQSERQRETPRPTQVPLSTTTPFSTTLQLRTEFLVISASAACIVGLVIGSGAQQTFQIGGQDTKIIPYITQIGAGQDVSLSTTAGTVTGYLIAYPS